MPWMVQTDALYFQPRENGVSFAIESNEVVLPSFQTRFGIRFKIFFELPHDEWELSGAFLHYHARSREKRENKIFFSTWDVSHQEWKEFSFLWRLHMGLLDVCLQRCFWISQKVVFAPSFGLSYVEIRHKLGQNDNVSMKNKFFGVGPQVGILGRWFLINGLALYGESFFGLLYGMVYVHQDIDQIKLYDELWMDRSWMRAAAGLEYGRDFWSIQLGYEMYLFPGQNQLVRFSGPFANFTGNQGDLTLHGLSFGLGIDF